MDTDLRLALIDRLYALGLPEGTYELSVRELSDIGCFVTEVQVGHDTLIYELASTEDESLLQALQEAATIVPV